MSIEKVWLTDTAVWIRTSDGKEACELFEDYPRLRYATQEQRMAYEQDDFGLHWEELDEDLSFEGFFKEKPQNPLYLFFMRHSELNASAIARRLGISQSLFAQYICGIKTPSAKRKKEIEQAIIAVGQELQADLPFSKLINA